MTRVPIPLPLPRFNFMNSLKFTVPFSQHRPETPENTALPSLETVAVAVKSISQEFNWTEAVIFVAGQRSAERHGEGGHPGMRWCR